MQNKLDFEALFHSVHKSSTIFLVGFMGSGKTTFGKQLADKLNYKFLDTDKEIESLVGMDIPTIFKKKGEAYFRRLENQLLQKMNVQHTVVATGGGMPCSFNNMELINKMGVSIYLKYEVEELFERLKSEKDQRPLIFSKTDVELFTFIDKLLKYRESFYNQAALIY